MTPTRIVSRGEDMIIDGHILTGAESLACNLDPQTKKLYLLITGEGYSTRVDSAEEKDYIINFYLKRIKDPRVKAVIQNFRSRPATIPLPYKTLETITNVFSPKRIMTKKLIPISPDEEKEIQLKFNFSEGEELYRYEYKAKGINYKWIIPKELLDKKGAPIPSLMQKSFFVSIGMGLEQGSRTIRFTLGEKLKYMGYNTEDTEKNPAVFNNLKTAEAGLGSMITTYDTEDKTIILGSPYSKITIPKKKGKGAVYEAVINEEYVKGINFEYEKRKALNRPVDPPYKNIPIALITDRKINKYEKNIRMNALRFINQRLLNISGATLLSWAGLPKSFESRKAKREEIYLLTIKILSEMGFKRTGGRHKGKDFRAWQFTFIPPKQRSAQARQEIRPEDTEGNKKKVEELIRGVVNKAVNNQK